MTPLIVGLGSGRCGTRSLAKLLSLQGGVVAHHEAKPTLSWVNEPDPDRHFRRGIHADVGFYYLPHVRFLADKYPAMRFICLQRDREDTINSFCRSRPDEVNWFSGGNGWNRCFPYYGKGDFRELVGRYWDDYYDAARAIEGERFRIVPTEALNDSAAVRDILEFAGIADSNVELIHITEPNSLLEV